VHQNPHFSIPSCRNSNGTYGKGTKKKKKKGRERGLIPLRERKGKRSLPCRKPPKALIKRRRECYYFVVTQAAIDRSKRKTPSAPTEKRKRLHASKRDSAAAARGTPAKIGEGGSLRLRTDGLRYVQTASQRKKRISLIYKKISARGKRKSCSKRKERYRLSKKG